MLPFRDSSRSIAKEIITDAASTKMDNSRVGDFYRPPPTSPRGHPKKRLRREAPPAWRDDTNWAGSPPSPSPPFGRLRGEDDARESKPHHLGGYPIESGLKTRGESHALPRSKTESDSGEPNSNSLENLERICMSISAHVQNIKSITTDRGYSPAHPSCAGRGGSRRNWTS